MTGLTTQDVLDLIRDIEAGRESTARHPFATSTAEPPHLIWGLGQSGPRGVAVVGDKLEFRMGEFWASSWKDLEKTDDSWITDAIAESVFFLRSSMETASGRIEELAARDSAQKASKSVKLADKVVAFLEDPTAERFEKEFSSETVWIDHGDEDDTVIAAIARKLGRGVLTVASDGPRLTITGPNGEKTITPQSRDVTLRAITTVLPPEIELRQWVGGRPADTVGIIVLPTADRDAIIASRSERALNAQFRRLNSRSKIFG